MKFQDLTIQHVSVLLFSFIRVSRCKTNFILFLRSHRNNWHVTLWGHCFAL